LQFEKKLIKQVYENFGVMLSFEQTPRNSKNGLAHYGVKLQ